MYLSQKEKTYSQCSYDLSALHYILKNFKKDDPHT